MCGRFSITITKPETLQERFGLRDVPAGIQPRYNIAPSQTVPVILNTAPDVFTFLQWGLVPHWTKDETTAKGIINARAETILERPSFREPFRTNRCLIPADSFYEWHQTGRFKRPYRIMMNDESLFSFAGIWDRWSRRGKVLDTFAIITTEANMLLKSIHERMPVILSRDQEQVWLADSSPADLFAQLTPYDPSSMKVYEISARINSPKNDGPEAIQPIGG